MLAETLGKGNAMRKLIIMLVLFTSTCLCAAQDITGFWTTIDDETKQPKSIVRIYMHDGKAYGRVVKLFNNPDATAKNVVGSPKILGLDILWDMQDSGDKFKGGAILDPKKGKVYNCEIWRDGDNLIVRGKIAFFGRNQTWLPSAGFQPAANAPVPQKPVME